MLFCSCSPSSEAAAGRRSFFYSFSFEQSGSGAKKLSIVSSKETLRKKTNAPSLPAADAGLLAEQLGHDLAGGNVLRQRVDVVPVGRADVVGLLQEAVLFFFFGAEREKGGKISFYVLFDPLDTLPPSKRKLIFLFLTGSRPSRPPPARSRGARSRTSCRGSTFGRTFPVLRERTGRERKRER